jgi:LytR cell envelope-related transcriptional attenuator
MSDQSRRSRPLGAAAAPRAASPAIAVVIALLAAVLGFFILKKLDGNDSASGTKTPTIDAGEAPADGETQDTGAEGETPASPPPAIIPVVPPPAPGSYTVVVANGSGKGGAAKSLTTLLSVQALLKMGAATNILEALPKADVTQVYFTAGNEAQGKAVASILGCSYAAVAMPEPPPVDPATIAEAQVLIVQGLDLATTGALTPCTTGAAATPAAPAVDPAVAPATPVISAP